MQITIANIRVTCYPKYELIKTCQNNEQPSTLTEQATNHSTALYWANQPTDTIRKAMLDEIAALIMLIKSQLKPQLISAAPVSWGVGFLVLFCFKHVCSGGEAPKKESKEEVAQWRFGQIKPITHSKALSSPRILSHTNQRARHPCETSNFDPIPSQPRLFRKERGKTRVPEDVHDLPLLRGRILWKGLSRHDFPTLERFLPRHGLSTEINNFAVSWMKRGRNRKAKLLR